MKSARATRASTLVDAMTGVLLLSQGMSEVGQAGGSQALAVVAIGGGVLMLGGLILTRRLGRQFRHFHAMVSLVEGLACAFVGVAAMQRGASYIQFAWLLAAVAFFIAAVIRVRQARRSSMPPAIPAEQ